MIGLEPQLGARYGKRAFQRQSERGRIDCARRALAIYFCAAALRFACRGGNKTKKGSGRGAPDAQSRMNGGGGEGNSRQTYTRFRKKRFVGSQKRFSNQSHQDRVAARKACAAR